MWKDVLESKYGSWRTLNLNIPVQNKHRSRWWMNLSKVSLFDQDNNWFESNMVWQVGDGSKFKFWEDKWLDNTQLKERYPRIYKNSMLNDKPIVSFGKWSSEVWEWDFSWRKAWFEWEKPMV